MERESELAKRRRLLREQKEALLGLQTTRVHSPSTTVSDASPSKRSPVRRSNSTFSFRSVRSSLGGQSGRSANTVDSTVCTGINIPPVRNERKNLEPRKSGSPPRRPHPEPTHAELLGEDDFVPDLAGWSASEDGLSAEDGVSSRQFTSTGDKNSPLSYDGSLQDENATALRCVTAIKFHKKFDDVVLSAHAERSDRKLGADLGTVALWGLDGGRGALQRSLVANSPVTALELMAISPSLVLGGTRSGNVLMWDTRVKTALPINTFGSDPCDPTHSHGRQVVTGIKTSSSASPVFFSSSSSGYLYKWSLSKTESPITRTIVQDETGAAELNISCIDLPHSARLSADERSLSNRSTALFAGAMDGSVHRLDGKGSSWNLDVGCGKHEAGVSAISAHPLSSRSAFLDDVLVSASADWTLRLWLLRRGLPCRQLATFDMIANGAVHDVKWSPQHATVFAAGDDSGVLGLFDVSGALSPGGGRTGYQFNVPGSESVPISKVQWANNSRYVCAGDANGTLSIWTCNSSFAGLPGADWMTRFLKAKAAEDA